MRFQMKKVLFVLSLIISASVFSNAAVAEVICFTDGSCVDIGDPSIHP